MFRTIMAITKNFSGSCHFRALNHLCIPINKGGTKNHINVSPIFPTSLPKAFAIFDGVNCDLYILVPFC